VLIVYWRILQFLQDSCLIFFDILPPQTIYEDRYVTLFNVVFTSVPLLLVSFTEQDVSPEFALKYPQLYRDSQRNERFKHTTFWLYITDAFYQAAIVFFFFIAASNVTQNGYSYSHFELGTIGFTAVVILVNLKLLMDCQHWNRPVVWSVAISVFLYFIFVLLYHAIVPEANPIFSGFYNVASTATFWTCVVLIIVVALLPSFVLRCTLVTVRPTPSQIVRERELLKLDNIAGSASGAGSGKGQDTEMNVVGTGGDDDDGGAFMSIASDRQPSIAL
jgi:magnesium-transporting ATPase (P-type)